MPSAIVPRPRYWRRRKQERVAPEQAAAQVRLMRMIASDASHRRAPQITLAKIQLAPERQP